MAINVVSRPEQLLRGVDRFVAVMADALPHLPALPRAEAAVPARWLIERGTTRHEIAANVLGGFPGSLRSMNRLDKVSVIATMRYLVVGEGTPSGFAIPMRDVLAVAKVRPDRMSNPGLRLWYRDGNQTTSFFLDCRGLTRGLSGLTRADQLMQFLVERGVAPVEGQDALQVRSPWLSWEEAEPFVDEELVWTGNGVSSVGGWFGREQDHCRVWLTDRSLLWAGAHQTGVHRIALADIVLARDGVSDRVSIGIADTLGHRFDISFDLAAEGRERNPRVRFMDALASRGVPCATAATPLAPWRAASMVRPMDRQRG
jgi:hypothetical protein